MPKTKEEMAELRAMIGKSKKAPAKKEKKEEASASEGEEENAMKVHVDQIKTLKSEVRKLKKELKNK